MEATMEARVSPRRQLPATPQPSKIPVRRESSLPSSGRSTPCSLPPHSAGARPGLVREASSPPGLLFTGANTGSKSSIRRFVIREKAAHPLL